MFVFVWTASPPHPQPTNHPVKVVPSGGQTNPDKVLAKLGVGAGGGGRKKKKYIQSQKRTTWLQRNYPL